MKNKLSRVLVHVSACTAFLLLPVLMAPGPGFSFNSLLNGYVQRDFFSHVLMLVFFYLNYYVFIPRFYFTQRYALFIGLQVLALVIVTYVPYFSFNMQGMPPPGPPPGSGAMPHHEGPHHEGGLFEMAHNLFLYLVVVFFSLVLKISRHLQQTQREKTNAELANLKAQVNPHFLFNTLNSIYSLALANSDRTANAIVKLSGMMRYMLTDAGQDYISLEKEIECLEDYIELQKLRLPDTVEFSYKVEGETEGKEIAPLLFLPFIENAFKYGVNPEKPSEISITIAAQRNLVSLDVKNTKVAPEPPDSQPTGIGISNTRSRLELLYPGKHELRTENGAYGFRVYLAVYLS
ncbi:MAG TPA: sensor histidine kinase [Chitinophagales bacterium]|nr:sensor histidine kinase [Chitinophagales bacterium]